jgi:Asp-tRNA(Asn)/Glu-tRNA(Gln) amidotransferase B subunit
VQFYDNGMMIPGDQLKVDVPAAKRSVEVSNQEAFALALEIGYAAKTQSSHCYSVLTRKQYHYQSARHSQLKRQSAT